MKLPGRVQVAGIIDQDEADLVVAAGCKILGFPLSLKDGREDLGVAEAAAIVRSLPESVHAVCITYLDQAQDILDLCKATGMQWVQLHGPIDPDQLKALKRRAPRLSIIKSLIVRGSGHEELLAEARAIETHVDAFITDTFDPATSRSGATGRLHDWEVSRRIVAGTRKPVILAGGLTPGNVEEAIMQVDPAAVDVHSGVEGKNGRKDAGLVGQFVRRADRALSPA